MGFYQQLKHGRNYMISKDDILAFQRDYKGLDVSNRVKAIEAFKKVQIDWRDVVMSIRKRLVKKHYRGTLTKCTSRMLIQWEFIEFISKVVLKRKKMLLRMRL